MEQQVPQHAGNQQAQKPSGREFYTPNAGMMQAQALAAQAEADKARAQTAILQQSQGLGGTSMSTQMGLGHGLVQQQPQVSPEQVQAEQAVGKLVAGLQAGTVSRDQVAAAAQGGDQVAAAALQAEARAEQQAMQQYNTQLGL